jgi:NAD(P)-dependent dehydrogenase (short-subunit alcohol dehydrogenase family)
VHCDVANEGEVAAAMETAVRDLGGLDILYNNAAVIGMVAGFRPARRRLGSHHRGEPARPVSCAVCPTWYSVAAASSSTSHRTAPQASPVGVADYAVASGLVTLTYYLASEYGGTMDI